MLQVAFGLFFSFYFPAKRLVEGGKEVPSKDTERNTDYQTLPDGEVGIFPERGASILSGMDISNILNSMSFSL